MLQKDFKYKKQIWWFEREGVGVTMCVYTYSINYRKVFDQYLDNSGGITCFCISSCKVLTF